MSPAEPLSVAVMFTDRACAVIKQLPLAGWTLDEPFAHHARMLQVGDCVRLEGVPTSPPLYVIGRSLTLSKGECIFMVVLDLNDDDARRYGVAAPESAPSRTVDSDR